MDRYARSFLGLVSAISLMSAVMSGFPLVWPEWLGLVLAVAILFAAAHLLIERSWAVTIVSALATALLLTALDSTPILLPLVNFYVDERVKFAVYALAVVPIAVAAYVLIRPARRNSMSRIDTLVLTGTASVGIVWFGFYMLGRFAPATGLFGMLVSETLVYAVVVIWPLLTVTSWVVGALAAISSRLTRASTLTR